MNYLFINLCLLDILYRGSPAADCQAVNTEIVLGQWEAVDPILGDHGITQSQPVYAIDTENVIVKKFVYDGACPNGQFRLSNSSDGRNGTDSGFRLGPYDGNKDIVMILPKKLSEFKYLVVWCRDDQRAYAFVKIPDGRTPDTPPGEVVVGPFLDTSNGVEGIVYIPDGGTFRVDSFYFDGNAPNATFAVGNSDKPDALGKVLPIEQNETDYYGPLPKLENAPLTLQLPFGKTVCDYKWLAVYCHKAQASLGHVMIPKDLRVPADHGQNDITWTVPPAPETTPMSTTTETTATSSETSTTPSTTTKQPQPQPRTTVPPNPGGKAESSFEMIFAANILILSHFYVGQGRTRILINA